LCLAEHLVTQADVSISRRSELLLRLRWLAILHGRVRPALATSGGVHTGLDALKAVMAGAHAVQLVSALLHHGPEHLAVVRAELARWPEEHEYDSLAQAQGSMSLLRCPDPAAFERATYLRVLQSWSNDRARRGIVRLRALARPVPLRPKGLCHRHGPRLAAIRPRNARAA
jgi:dihydroorotate dehydrogenase (fumarate)